MMGYEKYRVGCAVPCEGVDPHTGSFLTYGIITGWIDKLGEPTTRKKADRAIIERCGRKAGEWNDWCEQHAWTLEPFGD